MLLVLSLGHLETRGDVLGDLQGTRIKVAVRDIGTDVIPAGEAGGRGQWGACSLLQRNSLRRVSHLE